MAEMIVVEDRNQDNMSRKAGCYLYADTNFGWKTMWCIAATGRQSFLRMGSSGGTSGART